MDSLVNGGEDDIDSLLSTHKFWIGKAFITQFMKIKNEDDYYTMNMMRQNIYNVYVSVFSSHLIQVNVIRLQFIQ